MRAGSILVLVSALAAPAAADDLVLREGDRLVLARPIRFEIGGSDILPADLELVDALAAYLRAHPEVRQIEIRAHTDDASAAEDDFVQTPLGRRRANALRYSLVDRGVAADRVLAAYRGDREPLSRAAQPPPRGLPAPQPAHRAHRVALSVRNLARSR
jgi:outer membrane protein OmpA-like peptidoglycan-associated protein